MGTSGFTAVFAISLLLTFTPNQSRSESLTEFISQVRRANPDLEALKKTASSERFRAEASGYWDDPFFGIGLDEVPENDSRAGMIQYQLSQTLPFPGRLSARKDASLAQAAMAASEAGAFEREITVTAAQLYARAFYAQKALAANRDQHSLLTELLRSTSARYRTGSGDHHELILARIEISTLEVERLRLERELRVLKVTMNEMRSREPESALSLESVSIDEEMPTSFDEALRAQPELQAARANVDAAQADVRSAKLAYFPDFVLQGMYMKSRSMEADPMEGKMGEPNQWGIMVGFSIPLFFFGKQKNLASSGQAEREASLARKRSLENRLQAEWIEAEAQLATAEDLVKLYKSQVIPDTELAARTGRAAYVARQLPLNQFVDILRTQRTLSLEQAAAEIDLSLAKLRKIHLLSRAPVLRLAPMRPTLFSGGAMGAMEPSASGAINMGSGMRTPSAGQAPQNPTEPSQGDGMGGM